jgi:hypothetical protein
MADALSKAGNNVQVGDWAGGCLLPGEKDFPTLGLCL